jgi:hypothetical protein
MEITHCCVKARTSMPSALVGYGQRRTSPYQVKHLILFNLCYFN